MKKRFLLIFSALFSIGLIQSQVGINTKNPKGAFHLDGKSDNASVPTTAQQLNDLVVLENGRVGIGTINPMAKLVIEDGATRSNPKPGLKIVDGNEGINRVLTAEGSNGLGRWKDLPLSFKTGQVFGIFTLPLLPFAVPAFSGGFLSSPSLSSGVQLDIPATKITPVFEYAVTEKGYYAFEVRWWAKYKAAGLTQVGNETATHFYLTKNGSTVVDQFEVYTTINTVDINTMTSYFPLYATVDVGDILRLYVRPGFSPGSSSMILNLVSQPWTQSKVIVKLMDL